MCSEDIFDGVRACIICDSFSAACKMRLIHKSTISESDCTKMMLPDLQLGLDCQAHFGQFHSGQQGSAWPMRLLHLLHTLFPAAAIAIVSQL